MTEELRAKMESLRGITARLNKTTDDTNRVVERVDKHLMSLQIGIPGRGNPFWTDEERELDQDDEPTGETIRHTKCLAYGRTKGVYQVHVLSQSIKVGQGGWPDQTIDREEIPWSGCSRSVKLAAVATLPSLLENIIEEATKLADEADATNATVSQMLDSLGSEDPRPDQGVISTGRRLPRQRPAEEKGPIVIG